MSASMATPAELYEGLVDLFFAELSPEEKSLLDFLTYRFYVTQREYGSTPEQLAQVLADRSVAMMEKMYQAELNPRGAN